MTTEQNVDVPPVDPIGAAINTALNDLTIAYIRAMPREVLDIVGALVHCGDPCDEDGVLDTPHSLDHDLSPRGQIKLLRHWTVADFENLLAIVCEPGWRVADLESSTPQWAAYVKSLSVAIWSVQTRGVDTFVPEA